MVLRLNVTGMTCGHCAAAVTAAVKAVPAVDDVSVDLVHGIVTVTGTPDPVSVRAAITEEGYDVA